jgi:hypothetical protein
MSCVVCSSPEANGSDGRRLLTHTSSLEVIICLWQECKFNPIVVKNTSDEVHLINVYHMSRTLGPIHIVNGYHIIYVICQHFRRFFSPSFRTSRVYISSVSFQSKTSKFFSSVLQLQLDQMSHIDTSSEFDFQLHKCD